MKRKICKWIAVFALLFVSIHSAINAKADHFHHSKYEKYMDEDAKSLKFGHDENNVSDTRGDWKEPFNHHDEDWKKHFKHHHGDHDDWDDDDWDDEQKVPHRFKDSWEKDEFWPESSRGMNESLSFWNIWTRTVSSPVNGTLPFIEAKEVPFEFNGKTENIFVLPAQGQLFVSGEQIAKLLQLKYTYYKQSRILEISTDEEELIVRAGSNAAYENMVKTPMPAAAIYYEKTVYLPVSVATNAFGYRVEWDEKNEKMVIKSLNGGSEKSEIHL